MCFRIDSLLAKKFFCGKIITLLVFVAMGRLMALNASATPPPGYYLVWGDEFNGDTLDLTKWFYFTGHAQNSTDPPDAISVTNAYLTITTYTTNGVNYSGIISSDGHYRSFYGYY